MVDMRMKLVNVADTKSKVRRLVVVLCKSDISPVEVDPDNLGGTANSQSMSAIACATACIDNPLVTTEALKEAID